MIKMYEHGGSANHGCEAIVRSTCAMLEGKLTLISNKPEQDMEYGLDDICNIKNNKATLIKRGTYEWFVAALETKLTGRYDMEIKYQFKEMFSQVHKGDIWLSIGGDNYCYTGTSLIGGINKWIRKAGAKNVLWGCSVEPKLLTNPNVAKDIAGFNLITARESISYEALKSVNANTILVTDPAFTLSIDCQDLPDGWKSENMIGINVSPLILDNSKNSEIVMNSYRKLIEYILRETDSNIAFIPHVVWTNNDDRKILSKFYDEFRETGRVLMIPDCNCMQLKGYIYRCRFFIGARTHATIAAYSTCVPTLALGYSVKSRGIAKDIFGSEKHYVVPVQGLKSEYDLVNEFSWLKEHETEIHNHLKNIMPQYISKAYIARDALNQLL